MHKQGGEGKPGNSVGLVYIIDRSFKNVQGYSMSFLLFTLLCAELMFRF